MAAASDTTDWLKESPFRQDITTEKSTPTESVPSETETVSPETLSTFQTEAETEAETEIPEESKSSNNTASFLMADNSDTFSQILQEATLTPSYTFDSLNQDFSWKELKTELTRRVNSYSSKWSVYLKDLTIVLYFGTEHRWYGKRNIKGLMKIPEGLDDYINDYKMQVFEVAWLTEEQISRFRSDFKIVANFFVQKRKNKDYIPDDPTEIKHIDEVLKLLQVMTGDEHYKEVIRKKKGVRSMCDVAERLEKMGIAKGIEIGKSEGIIEGKMQVYKNLLERGFSEKEAKEITEIPETMNA